MEQRFNEKNVKYSVTDNVFWKGTNFSDELTWHYDLGYIIDNLVAYGKEHGLDVMG